MIGVPLLSKFQTTAAERFSILRKYSCEIETCESRHHASPHRLLNVFSHLLATAIPLMDTVIVQICVGVTVATGEASLITSRRTRANLGSMRELQNKFGRACKMSCQCARIKRKAIHWASRPTRQSCYFAATQKDQTHKYCLYWDWWKTNSKLKIQLASAGSSSPRSLFPSSCSVLSFCARHSLVCRTRLQRHRLCIFND